MKVEARYCDACGVKIAPDDLREGEAVEMEESVFYCKECKAKHAPKTEPKEEKKDGAGDEKARALPARPQNKRITSSRRIIARRIASGRLARGKAKVPPALTSSGETLAKSDRLEKPTLDKKKVEERAKIRAKLDQERKKTKPQKTAAPEPEKTENVEKVEKPAEEKVETGIPKTDDGEAAEKPKKKKKKKKDKAKKKKKKTAEAALVADEKKADEKKADEKKADEKADEKKADEKKSDAKPVEAKAEEKSDKKSDVKPVDAKAETVAVVEKPKKKKAESEELDELEEIESEDDSTKKTVISKKKDKEKAEDESEDEDAAKKKKTDKKSGSGVGAALAEKNSKLKTASRTRAGMGKRIGSKIAVDAALADPDALPKKPKLPMVPLMAIGGVVLVLLIAIPVMSGGKKPEPAKKVDQTAFFDDLRTTVQQVKDAEEIAARWDGLSEVVEGDAKNEASNESVKAKSDLEREAKSEFEKVRGATDRALSSKDFDGALKALADYPAPLRGTMLWRQEGPSLEETITRRRAAFVTGTALYAEAKRVWDADKNKDAIEGLYAAFPEEQRQTDEGKQIAEDFAKLISDATHVEIQESGEIAAKNREAAALAAYKKACEKRQKYIEEVQGDFRKEVYSDFFEWQVLPQEVEVGQVSMHDHYTCLDGKLTIKNDTSENLYIGKNKRDWSHFVCEFKVKVSKGCKAWFLGKVAGAAQKGYSWDGSPGIPITANAVSDSDKARPHYFQGIPEETWVTLQYRFVGKTWDVVVDGKEVFLLNVSGNNKVGGFGFMCSKGTMEIEAVKTKILSRRTASGDEEEE